MLIICLAKMMCTAEIIVLKSVPVKPTQNLSIFEGKEINSQPILHRKVLVYMQLFKHHLLAALTYIGFMITIDAFRQMASSFPEVTEGAHFEKRSFKVRKKIFATLDAKVHQACIKLSPEDQSVFALFDASVIFPVPNKWGKSGWTFINLQKIKKSMLLDALTAAYITVAPAKLSAQFLADKDQH